MESPSPSAPVNPDHESISILKSTTSIISIIFILVVIISGIISSVKTAQANDPDNRNWESDRVSALTAGGIAIAFAIFATPVEYRAALEFRQKRNSTGNHCLMVVSWIIYVVEIINGMAIFAFALSSHSIGIPATWVLAEVIAIVLGWLFMFFHKEAARTKY